MVTTDFGAPETSNTSLQSKLTWLSKFYSDQQLSLLSDHQIAQLYAQSQPERVPISELENTDINSYLINSEDGYVPAHAFRNKGKKECVEIISEHCKVTASVDHFFEMDTGKWKYASFIQVGEKIKTKNGVESVISVSPVGKHTVYDFHINSEQHRYYTNDISSHNSGAGKSLFLANLGVNWALQGMNVVYLTLELSENLVAMRIDSMLTDTSTRDVFKNLDEVEMKVKMVGKKSGALQVKYMPSGKTPNDIRSYIKEYEIKSGHKVDVLLIDYLDLLMPNGAKVSAENLFIKDKYVSEELRNLAMELNTVFVTAAQLNRCLTLDTQVVRNGEKIKIIDVNEGDWIESNEGPVQVTKKYPVTQQSVYRIKTKSGRTIECSANHKIPTKDGLKTINTGLKVGDKLSSATQMNTDEKHNSKK